MLPSRSLLRTAALAALSLWFCAVGAREWAFGSSAPGIASGQNARQSGASEPAALVAWRALSPDGRRRALERWRFEVRQEGGAQEMRVRHVLKDLPVDPGHLPLERPHRWHDPQVFAPGQPIPRRPLRRDSSTLTEFRRRLDRARPPRGFEPAFLYDWGQARVVRRALEDPQEALARHAAAGRHPDLDLAEAAILARLDDGSRSAVHEAFGHAYTTRAGDVYPITLYEAWSSGLEIEMPDVDVLGILHTLEPETRVHRAPLPQSLHKDLYPRVERLFVPLRRQRGLRESAARVYLEPEPVLIDGFGRGHAMAFHALWVAAGEDPATLAALLPSEEDGVWDGFIAAVQQALGRDEERLHRSRQRQAALEADRARLAQLFAVAVQGEAERAAKR